jgi:hypothetical protein
MRVFLVPPDRALRLARDQIAFVLPAIPIIIAQDEDRLILRPQGARHAGITSCHQPARIIGQVISARVLLWQVLEPHEVEDRLESLGSARHGVRFSLARLPPVSLRRLCGVPASVAFSRLMPPIQPFLDRDHHITIQVSLGLGSPAMATGTRNPREIVGLMDSLRVLRSGSLCGVPPVSNAEEQAVAQVGAT